MSDGTQTISELGNLMSVTLKTIVSEQIVCLTLDGLKKDGLLEKADEMPDHFTGLTRRQAIKRVGLGSLVMLPVISSIVAPQAVLAQSGPVLGLLAPCSSSLQCTSGNCWPVMGPTQCCVSTATTNVPVLGGNYAPGASLPGCYSNQTDCNNSATTRCCSGLAGAVTPNPGCAGSPGPFACICT